MDINKLKEIGLTDRQIEQVVAEFNRNNSVTNEELENKRKRDEILAVKDNGIRQQLIKENMELFQK